MPACLSAHPSLSIPALGAFQLHLTPFNSTPTFACIERPLSAADLADALIDRDNAAEALRALASLAPLTDALRHKPKCDVAVRLLAARVVAETETTPLPAHVATAMDWAFGRVLF